MSSTETAAGRWWEPSVRRIVGERRVVLAGGVGTAWAPTVELVRGLGATDVLVIATEGVGVGPAPDARVVAVEPPERTSMLDGVRFAIDALREPSAEIREVVEAFDPDHRAVLVGHFLNEAPSLCGRPFVHHRRPEWLALEDKVVVDQLWDAAGVRRAPSRVVPPHEAWSAARDLAGEHGTVWSADATSGWHGGGHHTRWVTTPDEAGAAAASLGEVASHVRVMPFLDGVACSVHGIVLHDGVVVLRPVEMVTLRRGRELFYAGCSTFWDPGDGWRAEMRAAARRVGEHLRATVAYLGAFTIDGVATADGFVPTELNPRPGAGLGVIQRVLDDGAPLTLLADLAAAGHDLGAPAAVIEREWLAAADRTRGGGTWRFGTPTGAERSELDLRFDGTDWHRVDATPGSGASSRGSGPLGSGAVAPLGARLMLDPATWPVGPSVAPAAAAFYRYLDDHHGTSFSPVQPAPDHSR